MPKQSPPLPMPEVITLKLLDYVIKTGNKSLQTLNINDRDWILRTYADCLQVIEVTNNEDYSISIKHIDAAQ